MATNYIVKPGDTLSSISSRFKLSSWKSLYFAEENKAFRAKRPNPDRIFPGDSLLIPDAQPVVRPPVTDPDQIPVLAPNMLAGKFPGGCLWAVRFRLPRPAANSGFIVQEVLIKENGTRPNGEPGAASRHYWEAWPIAKGHQEITDPNSRQTVAKFVKDLTGKTLSEPRLQQNVNDVFSNHYAAGGKGQAEWRAVAAFYEVTLPKDFVPNNPRTNSGRLLSTTVSPAFWRGTGLARRFTFEFDFQKAKTNADITNANAILRAGVLPNGTITSDPPMETSRD
jgi:hypothetical protein